MLRAEARHASTIDKPGLPVFLFSTGMMGIGALSVVSCDFAFDWQPVPAFHPGRELLAVLCGLFVIALGVALLFRQTAEIAARIVLPFLMVWWSLKVPAVIKAPQIEGVWIGFGEIAMLLAGGCVLFAQLSDLHPSAILNWLTGPQGVRIAQVIFGLAVIPVGLGHIFYAQITAGLVPSWMPFRLGLAYLTGLAQIACGLAILFSMWPRVAAIIEASMLALFALFVWGPDTWLASTPKLAGTPPGPRFPLTAFLITWVIAASALLIAANSEPLDTR
jgi:uncharacterized membrane protein